MSTTTIDRASVHTTTHVRVAGRVPAAVALTALLAALVVVALGCIGHGAFRIAPGETIAIVAHQLGLASADHFSAQQEAVLMSIRLPRVVLGVLTGAGLAVAGATMQGLFRNPLADPSLIGVSSGAALAAAATIVLGATQLLGAFTLPLAAFIGALGVAVIVHRLADIDGRTSLAMMLLAGIAFTALGFAGIGFFSFVANDEQLRNITFWNLGSIGAASWHMLAAVAPLAGIAIAVLMRQANPLNALALGEAEAGHLGVRVQRLKATVILLAALCVGALVAVTGIIGFVGLIAPHMVRLACGPDHRVVLPGAALFGATLVLVADLVARTVVAPAELPIGVLTAFLGVPIFLALLLRQRRQWSL